MLLFNKIDLVPSQLAQNLGKIHHAVPICAHDTSTFGMFLGEMHQILWEEPLTAPVHG